MSNYRTLFAAGQTGAATGDFIPVSGLKGSHGRDNGILVEPYAATWGTCEVFIETRLIGQGAEGIATWFSATANSEGQWLDLSDEHEIRARITGAGGTNVNAACSGHQN